MSGTGPANGPEPREPAFAQPTAGGAVMPADGARHGDGGVAHAGPTADGRAADRAAFGATTAGEPARPDEPAAAGDGSVPGVLLSSRYRLEQRIAAGGMGEVWRGIDEVLGRPVAIKLLRHAYLGDQALASRFRAEARYAAALSHPGIAQVFDYGEHDSGTGNRAYLVMELVPGEPLSAILARAGSLSADVTLDIIAQAASALQAAHASGIVHRDIKPGNVLVTAAGRVKITDFGIARAVQAAQAGHLTQTGMVMGTAQYVSPEQASGLRVTHASDVYSLGVVAYECLAGTPPFASDVLIALALAHVRERPPPLPASVPRPVSDMVMRMLAKRPEDRPASAQAVADRAAALQDALPTAGPGLADVTSDEAAEWFSEETPTSPRLHDGATTQLPINDPERLPHARRRPIQRRALVVAALSVTILGLGGVTAALMVNDHHAAATGGSGSPSPHVSTSPTHSAHHRVRSTPSQGPPAVSVVIPSASAQPSQTMSASPTPSATPTLTASPTPSASPTSTVSTTPTQSSTPTP